MDTDTGGRHFKSPLNSYFLSSFKERQMVVINFVVVLIFDASSAWLTDL